MAAEAAFETNKANKPLVLKNREKQRT